MKLLLVFFMVFLVSCNDYVFSNRISSISINKAYNKCQSNKGLQKIYINKSDYKLQVICKNSKKFIIKQLKHKDFEKSGFDQPIVVLPLKKMPEVPALHPVLLEMSCSGENGDVLKKGTKFNLTLPEMAKYKVCSIHKIQIKYEHVD